jgi:hypothetical protein
MDRKIFYLLSGNSRMRMREVGMQKNDCRGTSAVLVKKLKIAVEQTCELCHEYFPVSSLEIHTISRRNYKEMVRDPSARILIVCSTCHNHIHQLPVPVGKQRALVKARSFFIRQDVRRILGYKPKPYHAPDDINIPLVYDEYFGRYSWGSYRLSG